MDIKAPRDGSGPAYAFIEYQEPRDAEEAVRARDGAELGPSRLRVEFAKGNFVSSSSRGPPRRTGFRARVTHLPSSASWQDLKDFMRSAGDVGFADVSRDRDGLVGVVEYSTAEDLDRAIAKLDGAEFSNRFGDKSNVRVEEDRGGGGGGGYGGESPLRGAGCDAAWHRGTS